MCVFVHGVGVALGSVSAFCFSREYNIRSPERECVCVKCKTPSPVSPLCFRNRGLHRASAGLAGDREEVSLCQLPGLQIHHHTPQQVRRTLHMLSVCEPPASTFKCTYTCGDSERIAAGSFI